jgi:predicted nucleotidyltransferase
MDRTAFLQEVKSLLTTAFGARLKGVVLYGSEARGEAAADSDIDLLVLLKGPIDYLDDLRAIIDALYGLQLRVFRPIHASPADAEEYERSERALYRYAHQEGIVA